MCGRESKIDAMSSNGKLLTSCSGKITLENVEFNYPSRPDIKVMKGVSMEIQPGETVAFVGPSGCGKSTIISLLQRFYRGRMEMFEKILKKFFFENFFSSHLL